MVSGGAAGLELAGKVETVRGSLSGLGQLGWILVVSVYSSQLHMGNHSRSVLGQLSKCSVMSLFIGVKVARHRLHLKIIV